MLSLSDFSKNEIIKVLVEDDEEFQQEMFAQVKDINEENLIVNYLNLRNKFYKDAKLYSIEEEENKVELESVCEHYEGTDSFTNIGFVEIDEYYARESEIDEEDTDSEIDDLSSEEGNSFIASEEDENMELPSDHEEVDSQWNNWVPESEGEKRYKDMVDTIERVARMYKDEVDFMKKNV